MNINLNNMISIFFEMLARAIVRGGTERRGTRDEKRRR